MKRCNFIGKVHYPNQELYFAAPDVKFKLLNIYCTSFYGSNCWDLFSSNCERFYKAWNVACRIILNLICRTHRYLIETLSNCLHPKVIMSSRFVKFQQSLENSNKPLLRLLSTFYLNDQRSIYGSNLENISKNCDLDKIDLTAFMVKHYMSYYPLPE